ncbi:6930_t:CDS:2 [Ambispora gerdemannii]|uniref:Large ribosomal subunit protein mL50 n=1 Tax=Ambispora gerdemannii TaxID=144530 RepID=A0A9N9GIP0_9GLOM|nr:6930_t:CDS:2 [Ambispora gerdemannii]
MKITTPRFLHTFPPLSLTGFSIALQRQQHNRPVVPIHHHIFVASDDLFSVSENQQRKTFAVFMKDANEYEVNDMDEDEKKAKRFLPAVPTKTPQEVHDIMFNIIVKHCQDGINPNNWLQFRFDEEPSLKFKILKDCTTLMGRDVPNFELNKMRTVNDVMKFYLTEQEPDERLGHPVADWFEKNKDRLPPNMHFVPYVKERNVPEILRMRPNKREF